MATSEQWQSELEQERLLSSQLAAASKDLQRRSRATRSLLTLELCQADDDLALAHHVAGLESERAFASHAHAERLHQKLEAVSSELARSTCETVAVLGVEVASLEAQIESARQSDASWAGAEAARLTALRRRHADEQAQAQAAHEKLSAGHTLLTDRIQGLETELGAARGELGAARDELRIQHERAASLARERDEEQRRHASSAERFASELAAAAAERDARTTTLRLELTVADGQAAEASAVAAARSVEVGSLRAHASELASRLANGTLEAGEQAVASEGALRAAREEAEAQRAAAARLQEQLSELGVTHRRVARAAESAAVEAAERAAEAAEEAAARLEAAEEALETARAQHEEEVRKYGGELDGLRRQLAATRQAHDADLATLRDEQRRQREGERGSVEAELSSLREELAGERRRSAELEAALGESEQALRSQESRGGALSDELESERHLASPPRPPPAASAAARTPALTRSGCAAPRPWRRRPAASGRRPPRRPG